MGPPEKSRKNKSAVPYIQSSNIDLFFGIAVSSVCMEQLIYFSRFLGWSIVKFVHNNEYNQPLSALLNFSN